MALKKNLTAHEEYTTDNIDSFDPMTLARKRIGVYLGGINSDAQGTQIREIFDNSADENLNGYGDTITVRIYDDKSAEVVDHGRGLPIDTNKDGVNGIVLTLGTIGAGGKYRGETATGGLNGMGAAASNAASTRFDVTVYRGGKMHKLSFKEGVPGFFAKDNDPTAKFTPNDKINVSKDPRSATEQKKHPTGTTIRFWPDYTIFAADAVFPVDSIRERVRASAFLLPGLTAIVEDLRDPKNPVIDKFSYSDGLGEMISTIAPEALLTKVVKLTADSEFTEQAQTVAGGGKLIHKEVTRPVHMEVAFGYVAGESTTLNSFVNLINTRHGGTHESGLWRALSRVIVNHIKAGKEAKYLKAKEDAPIMDDVKDGFVGVISLTFPEPVFRGQTKEELVSEQIVSIVSQSIGAEFKAWLESPKNKVEVKRICTRVVEASRIRLAAKQQKDVQRKKSALETSTSMPSKLVDCAEPDSEHSELFIVEGDSALGTMRSARSAMYQALLPIRGKILNVQKATQAAMLANEECVAIIQVIGAGSGKTFNVDEMRYQRIIIAADADIDGSHIRSLLITLFHKQMRPLIEAGRLYTLLPPLFEVKIVPKKRGDLDVVYADDAADLAKVQADLKKQNIRIVEISRNKGLGEMDRDPTWELLMNPENRRLRRITLDDVSAAAGANMIELAMGPKVEPRRDWITENRDKIDALEAEASIVSAE